MSKEIKYCIQKNLDENDYILNSVYNEKKFKAAYFRSKLWDIGSSIKIQFVESSNYVKWTPINTLMYDDNGNKIDIDPLEEIIRNMKPEDAIKKIIIERIQPNVNLKFEFVNIKGDVKIGFSPSEGCYSLVGTDCKKENFKTLNFGWMDARTIMHEFGHVLGMIHEHQNPLGEPIKWNESYIYDWAKKTQGWDEETTYNNIIKPYNVEDINGSLFDYKSIMLYFFPANFTLDKKGTSQNSKLSNIDILWMNKMYPKDIVLENENNSIIKTENKTENKTKNILLFLLVLFFIIIVVILIFKKIYK